ncbi:ornithine carbamoyltransferase [Candidatus Nitrospira inopinata]|uniref:Ornithine carbamoyltransferase n=1 Tax=Candidatus Nitrospira inopinata TaxID=1715989 RepID=A0A0S4KX58_9BACT|nr:ornithine carbamoyltransferase [Candidatus Nitrospira inopinata]CUQ66226.1 Ornithine carbamoyltransferase [Candidatus Nitrospira inopinata]
MARGTPQPHRVPDYAKDLLDVGALACRQMDDLLRLAGLLKTKQRRGIPHRLLSGKTLGLLFQKPSTRTRVSFESGMTQLGGHALVLPTGDSQLSRGESIADTARVLSRYLDGIVIRTFDHAIVQEWAATSSMSVINGLTDHSHPCQALSDLLTIQERKGRLQGLTLAYVGDGNNVANSLIEAGAKMGMRVVAGCPAGYQPDQRVIERARVEAETTGAVIEVIEDPLVAVKEADVLYTDVWISMGRERERAKRLKVLTPYRLDGRLLRRAKPDAIVMHCLPAHRGEEITADVLDGPQSVVIDQAENRLHMQKAILVRLLAGRKGT